VPADFNLDGKVDLAFAQGNSIQVLLGNGDGTFAPPIVISGPADCLATGGFNGDGKPDLVGCDDGIVVYLGYGDGTFAPPITSPTPSAPIFAAVGDLNNDGKQDVAAVAFHGIGSNPNLGPVYVLYGNGDGTFQPALQVHTDIGTVFSAGIADLDGDGLPDLVAASLNLEPADFFTTPHRHAFVDRGHGPQRRWQARHRSHGLG
jgi:hypothetical protein